MTETQHRAAVAALAAILLAFRRRQHPHRDDPNHVAPGTNTDRH
jgi:MYXO-CTERM domain-containing protein